MSAEDFSLKVIKPNIGRGRVSGGGKKLTSSFDLVEEMWFLFVKIVEARYLPYNGQSFVQIKIGNYKGTTKYSEMSKPDPKWNQVFAFTKDSIQSSSVDITVRGKESVNDEIIGKITLNLCDIPTRVTPNSALAPKWEKLDENKGELKLVTWFGTQADEVFPNAWHSDVAGVSGDSIMNTHSKLYLSPTLYYLRVNVIEAQDLVLPMIKNRISEVKVTATLGDVRLMTKASTDKSFNPKWNEDLMFVAAEPFYDPLIITVEHTNKNEVISMGRCLIHLSSVHIRWQPEPVEAVWYDLENGTIPKEQNFASKLLMRISLDSGYHVFDEPVDRSSDYRATHKGVWTPVIGVLELGIIGATGLVPMKSRDGRETTDAYCVAKYGPKWVRTRTVVNSFSPKWNEQYTWLVYDPYTVFTIGIFDNCHLNGEKGPNPKDPRIGRIRIRFSTLSTNRIYTYSYPLIAIQPSGLKKMGEIQLAMRFTCPSLISLLHAYARPLFPRMHYILPLSVGQLDRLRQQAIDRISSGLGCAEPPLRKEVTECMLDATRYNLWSHRMAKANIQRVIDDSRWIIEAWKWFNIIKEWRHPLATGLVTVLLIIVMWKPNLILPTVLIYCFLIGIRNFPKRPRHPTHVDIKQSFADSTKADEWDEELDTFPSSKQGDVQRMRYDRLRSMAAKVTVMAGDLATQGEKLRSPWTWEDRTASGMFLAFWIMFFMFLCSGPAGMTVILFWGLLYVLRHPIFRRDIPCVPQNFFSRLPARTDQMLNN